MFDRVYKYIGRKIYKHYSWRKHMPDKMYLQCYWRERLPECGELNLENPQTFNEKLNWLKLYDQNPIYSTLADKIKVKEYVAKIIGENHVIPTIKTYKTGEEIDLDVLPNQFVIKCNHDSGSFIVCKDKKQLDIKKVSSFLNEKLSYDYYTKNREWPYKNIERRILAEKFVEDDTFEDLVNYKFLCFNGEPKLMYITVKTDDIWENFYDMDFKPVDISYGRRKYDKPIEKPSQFETLKEFARKLSKDIPFIRVDFYIIKGNVYFSEYTFYDWGGFAKVAPEEWNKQLGDWIVLPSKKK